MFVEALKRRYGQKPSKIIENAKKNLPLLDRAQLGTIHSFASHILRVFALQAEVDPAFEIDKGTHFYEIFSREFSRWLDGELAFGSLNFDKWKFVLKHLELEDVSVFAQHLCSSKLQGYENKKLKNFVPLCKFRLSRMRQLKDRYYGVTRGAKLKPALTDTVCTLENLIKALEMGDFSGAKKPNIYCPAVTPANWDADDWHQACSIIEFANTANVLGQKIIHDCAYLLKPFVENFHFVYAKEGFVSFDGLLVKARNLLRSNAVVRSILKKKYQNILIDEFQDTDPLQGEILLFLGEEKKSSAEKWQDVKLEKGRLFVVGDPKQSIYRFRGADIRAYDKFTGLMENQGAVKCSLQSNFRSQPSLTESINKIVSKVMQKDETQAPYVDIFASRKNYSKDSFELALAQGAENAMTDDLRQIQADFIAGWIESNCGKSLFKGGSPIRLRDIAVLFRSTTSLNIYLEALKRRQVDYIVEENKYFYSTQEITDLLNLLKAVINPDDKISLVGVLRSPLAGLTDSDIYGLKVKNLLDYRKEVPSQFSTVGEFYRKLRRFHKNFRQLPLNEFIHNVIEQTRALEVLSAAYNAEQTIANIFKFVSIISKSVNITTEVLDGLLDASKDFRKKTREGESSLADDFLDAVNVMTIHKAKGLEFPVVIIADINSQPRGNAKKNEFLYDWYSGNCGFAAGGFKDITMADLQEKEKKHSLSEEVRNFYVALTRAKDKLILVGNKQKPKSASMADFLDKSLAFADVEGDCASVEIDGLKYPIKVTYIKEGNFKAAKRVKEKVKIEDAKKWRLVWQKRINDFSETGKREIFTSATAARRKIQKKFDVFSETAAGARLLGTLCHKILENHKFGSAFSLNAVENTLKFLAQQDSRKYNLKEIGRVCHKILSKFALSGKYREISNSKIIARELPFDYTDKISGRMTIVRGIIDLVIEKDNKITIIDYKSEAVGAGGEKTAAAGFENQCKIYKTALSKLFPGKSISTEILFLQTSESVEI
jgi:ATP-dependent helicase/nuclease subunit A